jgi:hypothetical protein
LVILKEKYIYIKESNNDSIDIPSNNPITNIKKNWNATSLTSLQAHDKIKTIKNKPIVQINK